MAQKVFRPKYPTLFVPLTKKASTICIPEQQKKKKITHSNFLQHQLKKLDFDDSKKKVSRWFKCSRFRFYEQHLQRESTL